MAGSIKMPLGMEEGLGPGDFVLDGDPAPLPNFKGWGWEFWNWTRNMGHFRLWL